jgi:hypothetical protein
MSLHYNESGAEFIFFKDGNHLIAENKVRKYLYTFFFQSNDK